MKKSDRYLSASVLAISLALCVRGELSAGNNHLGRIEAGGLGRSVLSDRAARNAEIAVNESALDGLDGGNIDALGPDSILLATNPALRVPSEIRRGSFVQGDVLAGEDRIPATPARSPSQGTMSSPVGRSLDSARETLKRLFGDGKAYAFDGEPIALELMPLDGRWNWRNIRHRDHVSNAPKRRRNGGFQPSSDKPRKKPRNRGERPRKK